MTDPLAISVEPRGAVPGEALSRSGSARERKYQDLTGLDRVRFACESVALFGNLAGWGFAVLGILFAVIRLLGATAERPVVDQAWPRAGLESATSFLSLMLAGFAVTVLSRLLSAAVLEHFERASRVSDGLVVEMSRAAALLERVAAAMESGGPRFSGPGSDHDRGRLLGEIGWAIKATDWDHATAHLQEFEIEYPGDPDLSTLQEEFARARERLAEERLAQLEAARAVSDVDRVFEVYQEVARSLPADPRSKLDRDLAGWFLALIHKRLRTGRVQPDVVQLAARFAETFATTVEGASVRASLPTLRRSVGLCPRCAQPYVGVADACPNCLKGTVLASFNPPASDEPDGSE